MRRQRREKLVKYQRINSRKFARLDGHVSRLKVPTIWQINVWKSSFPRQSICVILEQQQQQKWRQGSDSFQREIDGSSTEEGSGSYQPSRNNTGVR